MSDGVLIVGTGGEWNWEQKIAASYNPANQTVDTEKTDPAEVDIERTGGFPAKI